MERLLRSGLTRFIRRGNLSLKTPAGPDLTFGDGTGEPVVVRLKSRRALLRLLLNPELRLGESYMNGDLVLERGTIADLLELLTSQGDAFPFFARSQALIRYGRRRVDQFNHRRRSRRNVAHHYDLDGRLYSLFLDSDRQYSCAYFEQPGQSLDDAQVAKKRHLAAKLLVQPHQRVLDIGCGWGGLICYAAEKYGVTAHGITMSETQLAFAREKIAAEGLAGRVTAELKDYAALEGEYDKIASIGMYEHIGLANIPLYLTKVRNLLADDGLFLNHAISRRAKRKQQRLGSRPEQRAILRYIFPGGELDDIGHTVQEMERHGLEVHDVENWRGHYALTTRAWCERLLARRAEAEAIVGPELVRIWLAYLAGVSLAFTRGTLRIYQTLVSKQAKGPSPLPPTRADLYR